MAKAHRLRRGDLVHKHKGKSANGGGPRSMCGRYGYVTHLWRNTTCQICIAGRRK